MSHIPAFQRSPHAPELPAEPLRFVFHFVLKYRWWYLFILILETSGSISSTLMPYVIGQVVQRVSLLRGTPHLLWAALTMPLFYFVLLNVSEVLFVRAAGSSRAYVNPRLRQNVTQELYAYLQQHSHRFISNNFAGALAHRISDTSQGVGMSLATVVFEFFPVIMKLLLSSILLLSASTILGGFVALWSVLFLTLSYHLARACEPHAQRHAGARSE